MKSALHRLPPMRLRENDAYLFIERTRQNVEQLLCGAATAWALGSGLAAANHRLGSIVDDASPSLAGCLVRLLSAICGHPRPAASELPAEPIAIQNMRSDQPGCPR